MKIEKISEDKIKITLSGPELAERNLNFQSLKYNTPEAQTLFLDMMKQAETEHGFKTSNCQLFIEATSVLGGQFVVTVTKLQEKNSAAPTRKKGYPPELKVKKKEIKDIKLIYKFDDFEQLCALVSTGKVSLELPSSLYEYKHSFFLIINDVNTSEPMLAEFGEPVKNSAIIENLLLERGNKVINKFALKKISEIF